MTKKRQSKPWRTLLMAMVLVTLLHGVFVEQGYARDLVKSAAADSSTDCNTGHGHSNIAQSRSNIVSSPHLARPMNHPQELTEQTFQQDPLFEDIHKQIDSEDEATRCKRYNYTYTPGAKRRRIFFGALVADDSMDVVRIHATETYDMYHTVALLESNTTFMKTPRKLRFEPGSELYKFTTSGLFGKSTDVFVDFWLDEAPDAIGMSREYIQRESILYRWKQQGMRRDDIAVVGDIDEFFSRDFLRAVQVCDVPEFQEDDCRYPKITPLTHVWESSPECRKKQNWFHPDLMLGHCVDGVGDPTGRIVPVRSFKRTSGTRLDGHGRPSYSKEHISLGRYPLWSVQDFRTNPGASKQMTWDGTRWGCAFHLHNFFDDLNALRHKYVTYGHAQKEKATLPLSKVSADIDVTVRCVHELPNSVAMGELRVDKPFLEIRGPAPIYFSNETYRRVRHEHVRKLVLDDEQKFGSYYNDSVKSTFKMA